MAKTQHTKTTNPVGTEIGSSVRTEDGCMIKSTHGTSTWGVKVNHDTLESCNPSNLITADNIDHDVTGIYNRGVKHVSFDVIDWDIVLNLYKNPYYDISNEFPDFTYSKDTPRLNIVPRFSLPKPHGFYVQAVIKFKELINIPADSYINWGMTSEFLNATHGGLKGWPGEIFTNVIPTGDLGGIYTETDLSKIPTGTATWPKNICGGNIYYKQTPESDPAKISEKGLNGVSMMISKMIFGGCAGDPMTATMSMPSLTITPTRKLLVEGRDF